MKYRYIAYGLNIRSDYPLPGVKEGCNSDRPFISIHQARPGFDWAGLNDRNDQGDFLVAEWGEYLTFCVESGQSITMQAHMDGLGNKEKEELRHLMRSMSAGFALALLLRQRGYLTLHSCVLRMHGKTVGFVGESGWGKSTLAEFLSQRGFRVLSDDVAAIDVEGGRIRVLPGHPLIKLRDGAARSLLKEGSHIERETDGRVFRKLDTSESMPIRLDALYFIRPHFSEETRIESIGPQKAILALMGHTHGVHLLTRGDYQTMLLKQCSKLVECIPVSVLHRKNGIQYLGEVLKIVEKDIGEDQISVPGDS